MSAKRIMATILALLAIGGVAGYLFYAPAHVTLRVMDAPPEPYDKSIQAIYVTFTRIDVHLANVGNESGWHTIVSAATTIDLIKTINVSNVLGSTQIPPGKYTEIRFFASEAKVTINGSNVTYTIPSGPQTGIKVKIEGGGFQLYGGQSINLLLDIAFRNSEIISNQTHTLTPVVTARVV